MLKLNQTVVYGTTGVCTVIDIEEKKIGRETRTYYVLKPNSISTSTVFVPADNKALLSKVHELVTVQRIDEMLAAMSKEERIWIENDSERKQSFGEVVMSGDRMACLLILKALVVRQKQLLAVGKRLHLADERILREVQRLICDEFSFVLSVTPDEVLSKILGLIEI